MLGIVIPAHNEEDLITTCLQAAQAAAIHPGLKGEQVKIIVVLDSCTDATISHVERCGVESIILDARNVGVARAIGAKALLADGVRWLAFTDADTRVAPDWLVEQINLEVDCVCGTVSVDDWSPHGKHADLLKQHFEATYRDADGHCHIHGANLGVSSNAYLCVGGFQHLACSEDVAFVEALRSCGATIAWSARPRVVTSSRKISRTTGGFADALNSAVMAHLGQLSVGSNPSI